MTANNGTQNEQTTNSDCILGEYTEPCTHKDNDASKVVKESDEMYRSRYNSGEGTYMCTIIS